MKKIILIPDSFKGTMTSSEICAIMSQSVRKFYPHADVLSIPVADGGEGSVDAFLVAMGGEKKTITVKGPFFDDMEAFYGVIDNGKTAIVEMAACAGLPLVGDAGNPGKTTTYGVGQLIAAALRAGCKKVIIALGGSATNDAGAGAAVALGVRFLDSQGKTFIPVGDTLANIARIDVNGLNPLLKTAELITMCDIDNPLYGETGAAYIFAPQKGATAEQVVTLDAGLRHISEIIRRDVSVDISEIKGAGAAGGMGGGMVAFLGSEIRMGIETVLDVVGFDALARNADIIFSGEGKIDTQSIRGKVVIGVAQRAKRAQVPLVAVVGDIGDDIEKAYELGVSAIFSINRVAVDFKIAKTRAKKDLELTMDTIMRFIRTIKA